jgi:branched-chain amino acid transport system permease protein
MRTADKSFSSKIGVLALVLVLLIVLGSLKLFTNLYFQRLAILVAINIILAVSLNLSNGFTGTFSLGHIGFMAIGAYVGALFTLSPASKTQTSLPGLPVWLSNLDLSHLPDQLALLIAILAGGTLAVIVAAVVGFPLMRLKGHYVSVATLGFLIIVHVVLLQWDTVTRGARGLSGLPAINVYWVVWIWVAITVYFVWRLMRSPYGRAMLSVREDEIAAKSIGVNVHQTRMIAFCVSAFLTAVAGVLKAHLITAISPAAFYLDLTFNVIVMIVVGGMGSITGSILGAGILTFIPEILRNLEVGITIGPIQLPEMYGASQIVLGIAFILMIIFKRDGLMGTKELDLGGMVQRFIHRPKKKLDLEQN